MVQEVVEQFATDSYAAASNGEEMTWVESQKLGVKKRLIAYNRARLDRGLELVAKFAAEDSDFLDGTSDILQACHTLTSHIMREWLKGLQEFASPNAS